MKEIEVIKAYLRGEVIEFRGKAGAWKSIKDPSWDFKNYEYRVADTTDYKKDKSEYVLEVMEAAQNGSKIECRYRSDIDGPWFDKNHKVFNWYSYDYRIKVNPDVQRLNIIWTLVLVLLKIGKRDLKKLLMSCNGMMRFKGETVLTDLSGTPFSKYTVLDWVNWFAQAGQCDGAHHKAWAIDQIVRITHGTGND